MKYLGMTLTKYMKCLYHKNFKSLKKEIKYLRRWKDLPCSWIGSIKIVKMAILPKAINAIPIKIPTEFFTELERAMLNYIWNNKRPGSHKTSATIKYLLVGLPFLTSSCTTGHLLLKTKTKTWCWYRNRKVDQWIRIEDPGNEPTQLWSLDPWQRSQIHPVDKGLYCPQMVQLGVSM